MCLDKRTHSFCSQILSSPGDLCEESTPPAPSFKPIVAIRYQIAYFPRYIKSSLTKVKMLAVCSLTQSWQNPGPFKSISFDFKLCHTSEERICSHLTCWAPSVTASFQPAGSTSSGNGGAESQSCWAVFTYEIRHYQQGRQIFKGLQCKIHLTLIHPIYMNGLNCPSGGVDLLHHGYWGRRDIYSSMHFDILNN